VSLEDAFWRSLKEIAAYQHVTLSALLVSIDSGRDHGNLSSAIRLFVLNFYRDQLEVREQSERVQAIRPPSSNGRYEPLTSVAQAQNNLKQHNWYDRTRPANTLGFPLAFPVKSPIPASVQPDETEPSMKFGSKPLPVDSQTENARCSSC
jgi:predicted DNA-binding ribbon-helix-helix protein